MASPEAVAAGYGLKTVNLAGVADVAVRCRELQAEMLAWLGVPRKLAFDGTLGSLLEIYRTHEDSPYRLLKPSSLVPYRHYLGKLLATYGSIRLDRMTGLDIKRWHKDWRAPAAEGERERLGAASMALAVLKAAMNFGVVSGFPDTPRLREVFAVLRLPSPKPRDQAPTAADIEKLCAAAHALGYPRAALCYALQFETTTRQWDLIGQWADLADARPSAVIRSGKKWIGPTWASIDANMVLSITPTKTENSTRAKVHVNLSRCPMVMAELARIPEADRKGPLIVGPSGWPFHEQDFRYLWRNVRAKAGLPDDLWNRDLRAGGVTEAEQAGVSAEDRAKLAGHSKKINEQVYTRDRLAASDRVVEARARFRREAK